MKKRNRVGVLDSSYIETLITKRFAGLRPSFEIDYGDGGKMESLCFTAYRASSIRLEIPNLLKTELK